jgi:hypothetical protein
MLNNFQLKIKLKSLHEFERLRVETLPAHIRQSFLGFLKQSNNAWSLVIARLSSVPLNIAAVKNY